MKYFIRDGKLTFLAETLLAILVLFGAFGVPYLNVPLWAAIPIWIFGFVAAGVLMFEGRASALGFKPFTRDPLGWRRSKRTYEVDQEARPSGKKNR